MKILYNDGTVGECPEGEELHVIRHSAAHILAQAIKRLYPEADFAYGPATDNGFYYDVDLPDGVKISEDDFPAIEAEMRRICKANLKFETYELPRAEAIAHMQERGEQYKVEHIGDLPEDARITFYRQGEYVDMCVGPHVLYTKAVKAFKLTGVSGAYWKNDANNKMLTRINGVAFETQEELEEYEKMVEEAKARDHRKIGKEMGLFMLSEYGPGMPFFLPDGMLLRNELLNYWRKLHLKNGYVQIDTPIMLSRKLWETSGHWDHYHDGMYSLKVDDEDYAIKPMNCPGAILVYQNEGRSYRDLPLRYAELGHVHRYEKSGELHGLMRVRSFTQDDAHILLAKEQIQDEVRRITALIDEVYKMFGFEYYVELSTRPDDSMGSDEDWEIATDGLRKALDSLGLDYIVNEGDGAFYGPKIDFHLRDCLGRTWQCGTIQLDFQLPERFQLDYIGADGEKHQPVMIHRVVFGSVERFIGILIEHFAGQFPTWLAPTQVKVLPISEKYEAYAAKVTQQLQDADIRASLDERNETLKFKIRDAHMKRIPYTVIVGAKEEENGTISLRSRFAGDEGSKRVDEFIESIHEEIASKAIRESIQEEK